jgi:hypothetical protein
MTTLLAAASDWGAWGGAGVSLVALALTIIFRKTDSGRNAIEAMQKELHGLQLLVTEMRVKVETMWGYQFRRAVTEGNASGMTEMNSPIKPTDRLKLYFVDIRKELGEWYRDNAAGLDDFDAAIKLEGTFGNRILKEIILKQDNSLPLRIHGGVCLIGALGVAKEENGLPPIVDLHLDQLYTRVVDSGESH